MFYGMEHLLLMGRQKKHCLKKCLPKQGNRNALGRQKKDFFLFSFNFICPYPDVLPSLGRREHKKQVILSAHMERKGFHG